MWTKLNSKKWYLIVTLTRNIALSYDTNHVRCHTRNLTCYHNNFFAKKKLKLKTKIDTVERGSYFNSYEDGFDDVQGYTSCALPV